MSGNDRVAYTASSSDSDDSTSELVGKKRGASCEIFRRSKRTVRSPMKKSEKQQTGEMDEIKDMMREIMREVKEVRKSQNTYEEEIKMLKTENNDLKQRITTLENKIHNLESQGRKNNIVIKGVNFSKDNVAQEVVDFLKSELQVNVKINKAEIIKPKNSPVFVVASMESWQGKMEVMKGKNKLRGTKKYIDDDLTKEERAIQAGLRSIAKSEKSKGKETKVGYKKIFIDGVRWTWDTCKRGIVEDNPTSVTKN